MKKVREYYKKGKFVTIPAFEYLVLITGITDVDSPISYHIMEDVLDKEVIAPFTEWVNKYGEEIGIFGGLGVDVLCRAEEKEIRKQTRGYR